MARAKADEKAALLLESYKEQAVTALDTLTDASLKGLLRRIVARVFNQLAFGGFCREADQERQAAQPATPAGDGP